MKIASVTLYCNEQFRLQNWERYYDEYSNEIYSHIIVNNGPVNDDAMLKEIFPKSIIVHSPTKNMLASYNLGYKIALEDPDIEAIMQITNDIRFEPGALSMLYTRLMADSSLAVIGPVVLKKDSNIIESFGYSFKHHYGNGHPIYRNQPYDDLKEEFRYVSSIPGGAIMVKRRCYEQLGAQDENLYMYADERDMFIRFDKLGYKEGVLCAAKAWHQHVFPQGIKNRSTTAYFLTARNRIYIAAKHNSFIIAFGEFVVRFSIALMQLIHHMVLSQAQNVKINRATIQGLWKGLIGDMDNNIMA